MSLEFLNREDFVFFRTRDYALINNLSISATSERLKRLEEKNLIVNLVRGLWANTKHPYFNPMSAVPYLSETRVYVSFLTALSRHGVISQIPQTIQIATSGRSRKLTTPIAVYEFIQVNPVMFRAGIKWSDELGLSSRLSFQIASPEKALLDCLYLSTRKAKRFSYLPELEMELINRETFIELLDHCVKDVRIKAAVLERVNRYYG